MSGEVAVYDLRNTTRALSVITSGDNVARSWYNDEGREAMRYEPGAVGTRAAKSFLRFGQFELFWQRDEMNSLLTKFMTWASITRDVEMQRGKSSCCCVLSTSHYDASCSRKHVSSAASNRFQKSKIHVIQRMIPRCLGTSRRAM